ncbi:Tripartite ATP-independent periplasmic transporter DctQ component [Desulfosarcina cetonica]|uniref:TRAP transporter small permease n=1 Tax=Desulfosarcina cetonica TaxID=90730 RepID=UPI0006D1A013|nr:TRAP transporter small permease [Desulfosarcina cetonica]VTR66043.1 Tripartite ATP-independent periplasmic transporter DctQ component [Desulfosarcina cetonica]
MKAVIAVIDRLERWGILVSFAVCLVALTISITTRYVFQRPLTWPDELTTYLFMFMTFLGASASIQNDLELKVDAVYMAFPSLRFILDLFLNLVRLAAAITFVYTGIKFMQIEIEMETVTPILQIPTSIVAGMLPFFGILLGIRSIECLRQLIFERGKKGR